MTFSIVYCGDGQIRENVGLHTKVSDYSVPLYILQLYTNATLIH